MSIPVRPILSALLRNRTGALLVAMQIAIALAVLVNAVYIVKQRVDKMNRPTGMDDREHLRGLEHGLRARLRLRSLARGGPRLPAQRARRDRRHAVNAVPLSGGGSAAHRQHGDRQSRAWSEAATTSQVDEQGLTTLGVKLIAGRDFTARGHPAAAHERAELLGPAGHRDEGAGGRAVPERGCARQDGLRRRRQADRSIIGIVESMLGSWVSRDDRGLSCTSHRSFPSGPAVRYMVRTQPGQRDALMRAAEEHMSAVESRSRHQLGAPACPVQEEQLPRGPEHGRLPGHRHGPAARDHVARHFRARHVQREHAHQADRHAPRRGRAPPRHRPLLPRRRTG